MTDHDHDEIADMADRLVKASDAVFELEWGSLRPDERVELTALLGQRAAHRREKLEVITENVRILGLLFAYQQGAITALEFVERERGAMLDPSRD